MGSHNMVKDQKLDYLVFYMREQTEMASDNERENHRKTPSSTSIAQEVFTPRRGGGWQAAKPRSKEFFKGACQSQFRSTFLNPMSELL